MRIGIITGEYPPMQGGVGDYTQIIARKFASQGHDVFVFTNEQAYESDERILLTSTNKWGVRTLRALRQWAHSSALDIVLLQFQTAAFGMSPWVHFLPDALPHTRVVTVFHDLLVPYLFPKAAGIRNWIIMRLAKASDGVIVTNHEDFRRLRHLAQVELIPIGSNIEAVNFSNYDRALWRSRAGAGEDDFLIAFFGFLNRSKGVEILLEDTAALLQANIYPLRLLMIGGHTGTSDSSNVLYSQEIDVHIKELGLQPYLTWTGFIEDEAVSAYLYAADAVVLPFRDGASYRRGSLMAAIQHGCPIITTAPEVEIPKFVDGENMLMVYHEIIDASIPPYVHVTPQILRLFRNPQLRQRLSEGALQLAKEFDWDQVVANYLAFIERVRIA